jgi:hypothetical protein
MRTVENLSGFLTANDPLPEDARRLVRQALEEMIRSVPFRTSRQCQEFLHYVVQHSLLGEEDSLRERLIGVEVFGRRPDYDQAEDPVVRIRAADVRKRIALFLWDSGQNDSYGQNYDSIWIL